MKTTNQPTRNSVSHSLLPITYLSRRSPATVRRGRACRAVVPQRRDEGGSPITYHYPATPKLSEGGSRIAILPLALALCCFALSPTPKAFGVTPAPDGGYSGGNTAEGQNALQSLTTGTKNTADGYLALFFNTSGRYNTATGAQALYGNTTGVANTANGIVALLHNTSGGDNTATGYGALYSNTTASHNTATGNQALYSNTTGAHNTASGDAALYSNTTGSFNTATGYQALLHNATGSYNTASGEAALLNNTTGYNNMANGFLALQSNTTGNNNIALGPGAGINLTTGDENIDIGNPGVAGESATIRIGFSLQTATFIAGIAGQTVGAGGTTCYVDNDGKLGVFLSARRFKTDIADMGAASEALLALRPVTFHYTPELDKTGTPQFGLVAEEVAKVNPDLVTHDAKGDLYTVRYEAVNAMLLNEFLKEHRKNEEQEATIAQQKKRIDVLTARLDEQASLIQKVSAQLAAYSSTRIALRKPASQTAVNNQ